MPRDFLHGSVFPKPLIIPLGPFRIFSKIRRDIRKVHQRWQMEKSSIKTNFIISLGHLWVVELAYRYIFSFESFSVVNSLILFLLFATGVVYSGGKFAADFVDTGGNFPLTSLSPVANLPPVSLTLVANLPPVSLTLVANLPPVSTTPATLVAKFADGVIDTRGKFAAGVVDPGDAS